MGVKNGFPGGVPVTVESPDVTANMDNRLCLAVCGNIAAETAAVMASERFPDVEYVVFHAECDLPAGLKCPSFPEDVPVLAVGGHCLSEFDHAPSSGGDFSFHRLEPCFYAVAGKSIVDRYSEQGAHLLIPGTLSRWSDRIAEGGFECESARHPSAQPASKLVLLDTGTDPESTLKLQRLAGALHLPFETVPVGLDYFRLFLARTILGWRLESERKQFPAVQRRMADYAMILDLIGSLTGAVTEEDAVRSILGLYKMIFAPGRLVYVPLNNGAPGNSRSYPSGAVLSGSAGEYLARFPEDSDWIDLEDGFVLRLAHRQGGAIGLLEVSDFASPGFKERYLKLSLTLARVSGLAISNARSYQLLRESEARFRSLSESSPIGIFQVDASGRCVYTNARWQKVAGLTLEESLGEGWTRALHPADRNAVLDLWRTCVAGGCESSGKYRFLTPRGDVRWVSTHMAPIRSLSGGIAGHVGTVEEITERRRMEEELIRAKKLEATGLLAGGMAHDFNNLLSIILGNISLMQLYRNPCDESLKLLDNVEKACLEARRLTHQFITFAGGGKPTVETVSTYALLKEAADRALGGSNVTCSIHLDDGFRWVRCDREQMLQALINLVVNGKEAMNGEGVVKISAGRLPSMPGASPLSKGNRAVISISDSGTGIAEENLARIFDPYFSTRQRGSQKGMGLGLTVAYAIVKAHGGDITVTSGLGEGATFDVYLPAWPEASTIEQECGSPEVKRRVLLMDEEELFRRVTRRMLERIGYEVETAGNRAEAVDRFKEALAADAPFDAAILSLGILEGIGGRETLRELLQLDRSVKAVVLSAGANDPLVVSYRDYGFHGAIVKPFAIRELEEILGRVISGKGARTEED